MSDRAFHAMPDLADRRSALLLCADVTLQQLLRELHSAATGVLAALDHPSTYNVRVELALHQLRRQIVVAAQPEWPHQLDELHSASRAIGPRRRLHSSWRVVIREEAMDLKRKSRTWCRPSPNLPECPTHSWAGFLDP